MNRALLLLILLLLQACVARAPSQFTGLSPQQARALASQLAQSRDEQLRDDLRSAFANHPLANVLVLSGGDAHGAFGCGVLAGWRNCTTSPRPRFDIVTGVSTGALMATFAYLGEPADDAALRQVYLHIHDADIFQGPISGPPDAVFDTAPLQRLIARTITADTLRRVAAMHHRGRRLYIATVELDTGALFIWPMSQLASNAVSPAGEVDASSLEKFRSILLAAASIPVLFPPVEIDGGLHVDAGLRAALFVDQAMLSASKTQSTPTVWVIFNGQFRPTPEPVSADLVHIGTRSLEIFTHTVELLSLREAGLLALSHNPPLRFRWICEPASDSPDPAAPGLLESMFDPKVTSALYTSGEALGKKQSAWTDGPPAMEEPVGLLDKR